MLRKGRSKKIPSTFGWILYYSPKLSTRAVIQMFPFPFDRRQVFHIRKIVSYLTFLLNAKSQTKATGKLGVPMEHRGTGRVTGGWEAAPTLRSLHSASHRDRRLMGPQPSLPCPQLFRHNCFLDQQPVQGHTGTALSWLSSLNLRCLLSFSFFQNF